MVPGIWFTSRVKLKHFKLERGHAGDTRTIQTGPMSPSGVFRSWYALVHNDTIHFANHNAVPVEITIHQTQPLQRSNSCVCVAELAPCNVNILHFGTAGLSYYV